MATTYDDASGQWPTVTVWCRRLHASMAGHSIKMSKQVNWSVDSAPSCTLHAACPCPYIIAVDTTTYLGQAHIIELVPHYKHCDPLNTDGEKSRKVFFRKKMSPKLIVICHFA